MFDRLMNVIRAAFNKGMKEMETPEVLAEQAQSQLEGDLKKLKEALTNSIAQEKMLEQRVKKNAEETQTWQNRAAMAVQQDNDEVAKQCIEKKQASLSEGALLQTQQEEQKRMTASLKEKYKDVEAALRDFQRKKTDLVTRDKAVQATSRAQELVGGAGGSKMDQWEEKIRMKEARSEALNEMSRESKEAAQFDKLIAQNDVDDELAALKEQLSAPKLIVDTGSPDDSKGTGKS